ncbi:putative neutral sphingomyelinase [Centruroides vittatus]|uniref:putative neutral sphingomyelinase n=1 Tax=Centruroides vittatus TaxID=120091 RepID=UPI00350F0784
MKMELEIKVFTLNVWGIVGISKNRKERIIAIASHLASSDYDFVFLQEVWSQEDYKYICKKTASVLPYAHYFYSGVFGSGVCILSKSKIRDTAMNKYSLNGYAHKLQHGDWFGGKVAGLCKVKHSGLNINLYISHLHAEYNHFNDQYLPHRVAQAFEFSQFISTTSHDADICIVAGDFNTEPSDLVYKIIAANAGCHDSFATQPKAEEMRDGATCGHPRNTYSHKSELKECPLGKRLDYIMYKYKSGIMVECLSCETPLHKIPGGTVSYSDHEAVVGRLFIKKSADLFRNCYQPEGREAALDEGYRLLTDNLSSLKNDRIFYFIMSCLIVCLLLVSVPFEVPYGCWTVLVCLRMVLSVTLAFCIWMSVVMNSMEYNSLLSAATGMKVLLDAMAEDRLSTQKIGI